MEPEEALNKTDNELETTDLRTLITYISTLKEPTDSSNSSFYTFIFDFNRCNGKNEKKLLDLGVFKYSNGHFGTSVTNGAKLLSKFVK